MLCLRRRDAIETKRACIGDRVALQMKVTDSGSFPSLASIDRISAKSRLSIAPNAAPSNLLPPRRQFLWTLPRWRVERSSTSPNVQKQSKTLPPERKTAGESNLAATELLMLIARCLLLADERCAANRPRSDPVKERTAMISRWRLAISVLRRMPVWMLWPRQLRSAATILPQPSLLPGAEELHCRFGGKPDSLCLKTQSRREMIATARPPARKSNGLGGCRNGYGCNCLFPDVRARCVRACHSPSCATCSGTFQDRTAARSRHGVLSMPVNSFAAPASWPLVFECIRQTSSPHKSLPQDIGHQASVWRRADNHVAST